MTTDRHQESWTNHEEGELAAAWRAGDSWNQLAAQFGRSVSAIQNRVFLMRQRGDNIPLRPNGRRRANPAAQQEQTDVG